MGRKLTTEDIKERIYELVGSEYELLSEYVGALTKVKIKHVACKHEFETLWNNFQSGCRCPKCNDRKKLTTKDIKERIYSLEGDNYKLLSEYVGAKTKIRVKHVVCDCIFEATWSNFKAGARCPKCANLTRKNKLAFTNEDIVQKIYELVGDEYTKLDDTYINSATKFKMRHNLCNCVYEVSWDKFQQGKRCPKCNQSKGEKFIADYLTNHNISFATEVRFDDCRYKLPLPFDFGILDSEKKIVALIEFDGEQHYKSVSFFGGQEALQQTQLRDAIKDDYCKAHKIPLLRIRFDEDIEEKLNLFINQEAERKV